MGVARGADLPQGYARQLDGCGGMRVAWAWRLHKTYKTYKTYKMMMGAPRDTPWVCLPQWGMTRAIDVPEGGAGFFNGNGGVRAAGVWRLHKTYKTYKTYKIMIGAPVFALTGYAVASLGIPRGFACRCGVGREWADMPPGYACLMATVVCRRRGCGACLWTRWT